MDSAKIGRSIALLRKQYGMTQLDLAKKLGVTDKAVSRWERGMGTPDVSLLVKLSIILDIDVETLLEGNVTNLNIGWKGVLILNYAGGISPVDFVYGKRVIYLQLCYFLLVGITNVMIIGKENNIRLVKEEVGDGNQYGFCLKYETDDMGCDSLLTLEKVRAWNKKDGLMVVDGLEFIYGKDFTKYLHRVMNNMKEPVQIFNFEQCAASICFLPHGWLNVNSTSHTEDKMNYKKFNFDRGMTVFPIRSFPDLYDAGCFMRVLETHQQERVLDIEQIAERRNIRKHKEKVNEE